MATIAAVVDMGTNSVKLTVGKREDDGSLTVLADQTQVTRLGKNVDASGNLDPEAVRHTLEALGGFAAEAKRQGATQIAAVGTSALRDAGNGAAFVREAQSTLGGTVEVISGEREAQLIYASARRDPDLNLSAPQYAEATLATIDIGGGSTEVVIGKGEETPPFQASLQLGAVRLTERALRSDPPTPDEMRQATEIADKALAHVPAPSDELEVPMILVVGSGGTIANLAAMEKALPEVRPHLLHGTQLTRQQIEARIEMLAALTVAERRAIPGLEPDRADVILAGAIIQARALHHFNASAILVSARGLRYGLLYELLDAVP